MQKTTIQITGDTLNRLKLLKQYERESYDYILNRLLDEAEEETLSEEEIEDIKIALENIKKNKVKPLELVAKELGIILE